MAETHYEFDARWRRVTRVTRERVKLSEPALALYERALSKAWSAFNYLKEDDAEEHQRDEAALAELVQAGLVTEQHTEFYYTYNIQSATLV